MAAFTHTQTYLYGFFFSSSLVNKTFKLLLLVTRAIFSFVVVLAKKALWSSMSVNTNSESVSFVRSLSLSPLASFVLLI